MDSELKRAFDGFLLDSIGFIEIAGLSVDPAMILKQVDVDHYTKLFETWHEMNTRQMTLRLVSA